MGVIAIALWIVFFMVSFVGRSVLQWRRTGDLGFRLARDIGIVPRVASALMVAGLVGGFVGAVVDGTDVLGGVDWFAGVPIRTAGLGVMAVGILLTAKAQLDLRDSWRIGVDTDERTELITNGVYAVVRNPIFSGMLLFSVGAAFATPNWPALAMPAVVLAGLELQVRAVEEPYLARVHGDAFRRYASRAGRFVPSLGRL